MKIKYKLLFGFGSIVLVLSLAGSLTIINNNSILNDMLLLDSDINKYRILEQFKMSVNNYITEGVHFANLKDANCYNKLDSLKVEIKSISTNLKNTAPEIKNQIEHILAYTDTLNEILKATNEIACNSDINISVHGKHYKAESLLIPASDSLINMIDKLYPIVDKEITDINYRTKLLAYKNHINQALLSIMSFLLSCIVCFFIIKSIVKPIRHLLNGIYEIEKGNFNFKIKINSKDEFSHLGIAINRMAENFKNNLVHLSWVETRTTAIFEGIQRVGKGDYSEKINVTYKNDIFDSLASGINLMSNSIKMHIDNINMQHEYLDKIINGMIDFLIVINTDGTIRDVNNSTLKLLEYDKSEIIGIHIDNLFYNKNSNNIMTITSSSQKLEKFFISKKGSIIPVLISISVINDHNGNKEGIVCLAKDITELKAVYSKSIMFSDAVSTAIDAILITDTSGTITYANKAAIKLFDYPNAILIGLHISDITSQSEIVQEILLKLLSGSSWTGELMYRRRDSQLFPGMVSVSPIKTHSTEIIGFLGWIKDLTMAKQIEIEREMLMDNFKLRVKELNCLLNITTAMREHKSLETLIETITDYIPNGFRYPEFTAIKFKFDNKEFKSYNFSDSITQSSLTRQITASGTIFGNINVYYLNITAQSDYDHFSQENINFIDIIANTLSEVIEKYLSEQAESLVAQELHIRNRIVETFITAKDKNIYDELLSVLLIAFKSEFGVFGYIDENGSLVVPSMTKHIWEQCKIENKKFIFPADSWGNSIWPRSIREKKILYSNEPSTLTPEGHITVTRNMAIPIIHKNTVIGLIHVANKKTDYDDNDLNLAKNIADYISPVLSARNDTAIEEKARLLSEKEQERLNLELIRINKELEQIIYVTSHDLRSPLVNIQGFSKELSISCDILKKHIKEAPLADKTFKQVNVILDEEMPESINFIGASVNKMDSLLSGLLRLSRFGRAALFIEKLNMNLIISECLKLFEYRCKNNNIIITYSELPECTGDKIQISQVFSNLIENAIKYNSPLRNCIITISGIINNGNSVYCVEDNGIGIPEEHLDKIFEIFHRLNPGKCDGEGLGLTIVRRSLERQSGRIWVESVNGKGSRFYISMPE